MRNHKPELGIKGIWKCWFDDKYMVYISMASVGYGVSGGNLGVWGLKVWASMLLALGCWGPLTLNFSSGTPDLAF